MKHAITVATVSLMMSVTPCTIVAQSNHNFRGGWMWQEQARKNRQQVGMFLDVVQTGKSVRGTYSISYCLNGQPQVEDGNQTPFIGTIKGDTATIKFDPGNTTPLYVGSVKYKEPPKGTAPSVATITRVGKTIKWTLTNGPRIFDLPIQITMNRVK